MGKQIPGHMMGLIVTIGPVPSLRLNYWCVLYCVAQPYQVQDCDTGTLSDFKGAAVFSFVHEMSLSCNNVIRLCIIQHGGYSCSTWETEKRPPISSY